MLRCCELTHCRSHLAGPPHAGQAGLGLHSALFRRRSATFWGTVLSARWRPQLFCRGTSAIPTERASLSWLRLQEAQHSQEDFIDLRSRTFGEPEIRTTDALYREPTCYALGYCHSPARCTILMFFSVICVTPNIVLKMELIA